MSISSGYFNGTSTVGTIVEKGRNNFDLLRLLAALSVIYSHAFPLFRHTAAEPVGAFLGFTSVGTLAVDLFFFLSGMLVTASYLRSASLKGFLYKRAFRIWPGLIVCVLITVFIIGPVFSGPRLRAYFGSAVTWHYLGANILQYHFSYILPGVFTHNTYPDVVNGSLWTLSAEIRSYLFILAAGQLRLFRKRTLFLALALLLFAGIWIRPGILIRLFQDLERVYFFLFFLAGVVVYLFKEKIILHPYIALLLIAVWLAAAAWLPAMSQGLFYVAFLYALLVMAQHPLLLRVKLRHDYSYGIYIYGFLVQQCFAALYPAMSAYASMAVCFPVVILIALLSWHCVERPALLLVRAKFPDINKQTWALSGELLP